MSKVETQYKEPQTNAKHSGIGTEVGLREGREVRGAGLRNWMTGKLRFSNNPHELPSMVFRDSAFV